MQARDIMTPEPVFVTPHDSIAKAAELMRDYDIGIVPVVDSRETMRLQGVITDRDIAIRCVAESHSPSCEVSDHMTSSGIDAVQPDMKVEQVIVRMEQDRIRRIPVVDDRNRLLGIIAQADLATKVGPTEPLLVEELLQQVSERRVRH